MMTFKPAFKASFTAASSMLLALTLLVPMTAYAQFFQENPDWKEAEAPPPPAYDVAKLLTFDVNGSRALVYGVDPASIRISNSDGVVRYVMVATSSTGVRNVMYEGLHCASGEWKTYARQFDGTWQAVANPQWQSVFNNMPSTHALAFAKVGACDGTTTASNVAEIVTKIKTQGRQYLDQ